MKVNLVFKAEHIEEELPGCRVWDQEDFVYRLTLPSGEYIDYGDGIRCIVEDDPDGFVRDDLQQMGIDYKEV